MVEREPITVLLSEKGWIRALRGHDIDPARIEYKDGDGALFSLTAETTDKLLVFATDGRVFTLAADKLPRGRGFGEPLRLSIDLANDQSIFAIRLHRPGTKLIVASSDGRGFIVPEEQVIAQTRTGRQIVLPADGAKAEFCVPVTGTHVATVGDNRKILIFPVEQLPTMGKGRGVMLQRFKDGGLSDVISMTPAAGLNFPFGTRQRTVTDLTPWLGDRAGAGRLAPPGFPRDNKFG
jgi:topoisomerase-4 subunit A